MNNLATFPSESKYLEVDLSNVTLVLHDWGSSLGFHYAMRHESNIKGIGFMEAVVKPMKWKDVATANKIVFKLFRTSGIGWFMLSAMNLFFNVMMPQMIVRKLSAEENDYYMAPFKTIQSRKPVRQWPSEIPFDGQPSDVYEAMSNYSQKIQESDLPKILFYATPGLIIDAQYVDWCRQNIKNLDLVDIGEGLHYIQEDNPHLIGEELARWVQKI